MSSPLTAETTPILDDLRRIVRVLRESSRAAEQQLGVSGAQLFVLRCLAAAPGISLNALAARTRTHQSTVSVVVKRLARAGLVSRSASREDARKTLLALTKRGERLLERAPLAAQDRLIQGIEQLSAAERKRLAEALRAWVNAMRIADEPPQMFFERENPRKTEAARARRRGRSSAAQSGKSREST